MPAEESTTQISARSDASVVGAIPARFSSARLPGKPLRQLAGRPLIEHVYRRATESTQLDRVVVLTDDQRIVDVVRQFGGEVEMTPGECVSGTDRVAAAARDWTAAAIVNIQGDEPLIEPVAIDLLATHLRQHPEDGVATLAAPAEPQDRDNPEVVKVVTDRHGAALYFSRSPIPYLRGRESRPSLRHIGIYGYQRSVLMQLAAMPPSPLEQSESLEQLRMLENGIGIRVLRVAQAWPGVDTIEDLERVERILQRTRSAST